MDKHIWCLPMLHFGESAHHHLKRCRERSDVMINELWNCYHSWVILSRCVWVCGSALVMNLSVFICCLKASANSNGVNWLNYESCSALNCVGDKWPDSFRHLTTTNITKRMLRVFQCECDRKGLYALWFIPLTDFLLSCLLIEDEDITKIIYFHD